MRNSKEFSIKDKMAIVLASIKGEESVASLARRYGVSETAIYRWKDQFLEGARHGLSGNNGKDSRITQLERELAERDRVIGELTVANRILKKTLR